MPNSLLSACRKRKRPFFLGLSCSGGGGDSATGVAGAGECFPLATRVEGGRGGVTARRRFSCRVCRQPRLRAGRRSVDGVASPSLRCAHDRPRRVRSGALLVRGPVLVVGRLERAAARAWRGPAPLLVRLLVGVLLLVLLVLLLLVVVLLLLRRPVVLRWRPVAARRPRSLVRRGRRMRPLGAASAAPVDSLRRVDAAATSGSAASHGGLAPQVFVLLLQRTVPRRSPLSVVGRVVGRRLREEVGRDQTLLAAQLAKVEAILVHVAVHVDHVARAERQLRERIWVRAEFSRVVIVESYHPLGLWSHNTSPRIVSSVLSRSRPRWLIGLVVQMYLGHHVARHKTYAAVALSFVKTILVLAAIDLDEVPFLERQLLVGSVRIGRHGLRVVVEQRNEPAHTGLPLAAAAAAPCSRRATVGSPGRRRFVVNQRTHSPRGWRW